jgi:hypothetical protein
MPISTLSRLHRNPELVHTELDGHTLMMSIEAGKYFSLNHMGSRIWQLIEHPVIVSDVVASLEREFDVDVERCRAETCAFLDHLATSGLVVVETEP